MPTSHQASTHFLSDDTSLGLNLMVELLRLPFFVEHLNSNQGLEAIIEESYRVNQHLLDPAFVDSRVGHSTYLTAWQGGYCISLPTSRTCNNRLTKDSPRGVEPPCNGLRAISYQLYERNGKEKEGDVGHGKKLLTVG